MSSIGNGYLSGNMLVDFPFEDGQTLNAPCEAPADEIQSAFRKCFVDAAIHFASETVPNEGWPAVRDLVASGSMLHFVLSAGGHDVPLMVGASSTRFPIVSGEAPWGHYVLVLSSDGISNLCDVCSQYSSPSSPGISSSPEQGGDSSLRLCARCVTVSPGGLRSIKVYDGVSPYSEGPHFVLSGDVSIAPGNNMGMSEPDDDPNGISLSATPGAGLGALPCKCEEYAAASPLSSPDGHTRFFNDTCYDLEPMVWSELVEVCQSCGREIGLSQWRYVDGAIVKCPYCGKTAAWDAISQRADLGVLYERKFGTLNIHAKCSACCTCDMYESIVNDRLKPLADAIRQTHSDIGDLASRYQSAVHKFNRRIGRTTLSDMSVVLTGMPLGRNLGPKLPEDGKVSGKMSRCAFNAVVRNSSYSVVSVGISSMSGTDEIVEATATWSDKNGSPKVKTVEKATGFAGNRFPIYPGRSLAVTFVSVKKEMVKSVATGGFTGAITVSLGSLGQVSRTVRV